MKMRELEWPDELAFLRLLFGRCDIDVPRKYLLQNIKE